MPSADAVFVADRLRRRLSWAVILITFAVLFGLQLPMVLTRQDAYRPIEGQYLAIAVFVVVTVWVTVAIWHGRPVGRWRWPLIAITLAASVIATATVAAEHLLGMPHWSYGTVGWPLAVVAMDRGVGLLAGLLLVHNTLTAIQVAQAGQMAVTLSGAIQQTLITSVFQLAVAYGATVLRRIAQTAANVAQEEEDLRIAEDIRDQVHDDRKNRYAALVRTTVPLLDGLATGSLDPGDHAVRRACTIEGARMRRLFAENAEVADPLAYELGACIDLAERRGVSVQLIEHGERIPVPKQARRLLTEPAVVALASAEHNARVTVVGMDESVTVSVVADAPGHVIPTVSTDEISTSIMCTDDRIWVETTWTPNR